MDTEPDASNLPQTVPKRCCAQPTVTTWTHPNGALVVACHCGRRIEIPLSTLTGSRSITVEGQNEMLREIISQGFGVHPDEFGRAWMFDLRGDLARPMGYLMSALQATKKAMRREGERDGE